MAGVIHVKNIKLWGSFEYEVEDINVLKSYTVDISKYNIKLTDEPKLYAIDTGKSNTKTVSDK